MIDGDERAREYLEIDALLDGEPVDPHVLRVALNDLGMRDYLIEALLLRRVAREGDLPRTVVAASARPRLVRVAGWLAAGIVLTLGIGAAYVQGRRAHPAPASVEIRRLPVSFVSSRA
jgi:hypothetical protein